MTAMVAPGPVLSDSMFKTRPSIQNMLMSDSNAGGNSVYQIEKTRMARQMKFPSLSGRGNVDSLREPQNLVDSGFKKWNDEGDHRAPAPLRSCDNIIDPISGFVSPAGDVDRGTGHTRIPSMQQIPTTPQSRAPQDINSNRLDCPSAPPVTRRESEDDPGVPYVWGGRKMLDSSIRANLKAWTEGRDPDNEKPKGSIRDQLALQYMYTSSTQRSYEEVPWERIVPSRRWAPVSTLEKRPDMISQVFTNKIYDPASQDWQKVGRSWDWFQTRQMNYKTGIPIPGTVFCSHNPRAQQIPGYSGCIGSVNIEERDNMNESFTPLTVKRVPIPRPADSAHRPNIPGYQGCSQYRPDTAPAHSLTQPPEPETTRRVHRRLTVEPNRSLHRRDAQMSRMVTTVPPGNPFNQIDPTADPTQSTDNNKGRNANVLS